MTLILVLQKIQGILITALIITLCEGMAKFCLFNLLVERH